MKRPKRPSEMTRTETYGNIELRFRDGELDEVVVLDTDGRCVVHLEHMNAASVWLGLYGTKKIVTVTLNSAAPIRGQVTRS